MSSKTRLTAAAALGAGALIGSSGAVMASTYVVRPGDTLADIAVTHGTTVGALAEANQLTAEDVAVGQLLQIPDGALGLPGYTAGASDVESYIVGDGDTLLSVARRFGVDPTALARSNSIRVSTSLDPGTWLEVPGRLVRANALLTHVADAVGLDPVLLRAVGWHESGWQQNSISPTGAVGIMQIELSTGDWISEHLSTRPLDLRVARDNVEAGALLLHHLLSVHGGDAAASLAAYYQGDASIAQHGLYSDTVHYQRDVLALMAEDA